MNTFVIVCNYLALVSVILFFGLALKERKTEYNKIAPRTIKQETITIRYFNRTPYWKVWERMVTNIEVSHNNRIISEHFNLSYDAASHMEVALLSLERQIRD